MRDWVYHHVYMEKMALLEVMSVSKLTPSVSSRIGIQIQVCWTLNPTVLSSLHVQSLGERNREAVMEPWGGSHLGLDGGKRGWQGEPAFLGSLSMNPPGDNLLQVSFCSSLVALTLTGIQQAWNFFFSLWSLTLHEY